MLEPGDDILAGDHDFAFVDGEWKILTDDLLLPDDIVKVYHEFDIRDI